MSFSRLLPAAAVLAAVPGCISPSGNEMLIVGGIVLLLFGGSKLPSLMRSMGAGINEFKKGLKEGEGGDEARKIGDGDDGSPS